MRGDSQLGVLAGCMIAESTFGEGIEFPSLDIRLELTIPCLSIKGGKPLPKRRKLVGRKFLHFALNLFYSVHALLPSGAKARSLFGLFGTAKAVPFHESVPHHQNASIPVTLLPMISVWMSCVPS